MKTPVSTDSNLIKEQSARTYGLNSNLKPLPLIARMIPCLVTFPGALKRLLKGTLRKIPSLKKVVVFRGN